MITGPFDLDDFGGMTPWTPPTYLVGGLEHFICFHTLGIIIPIDLYFSEGLKPPTCGNMIMVDCSNSH